MGTGKILALIGVGVIILVGLIGLVSSPSTPPATESPTVTPLETLDAEVLGEHTGETVLVSRVIDGDTFEIEGGQRVRLLITDTPETVHPSKPVECMGKEASAKTKELIEGKQVRLEKDISETDRYDRLLRYVYLEDGRMLNELLIREGFANAVSYPPDVKYLDQLREAEQSARENKWGLWSDVCSSPTPATQGITTSVPTKAPVQSVKPVQSIKPTPTKTQPPANCSADIYNCGDFNSCAEVMAVFNACPGDPNRLDGDDDGIPCEELCG